VTQTNIDFARVSGAIGTSVLDFLRARLRSGVTTFHADQLRAYVTAAHPRAPGSADRILRDLRKRGACAYVVVDRRASLYRVEGVAA